MTAWLVAIGGVILGVGLAWWVQRRRRRSVIQPPVTLRWLNDYEYRKDGDDRTAK